MGINLGKTVNVFDQNKNQWFTWKDNTFVPIETPTLSNKFAGIGTREINESGKQAIRDVYTKTFSNIQKQKSTTVEDLIKEKIESGEIKKEC